VKQYLLAFIVLLPVVLLSCRQKSLFEEQKNSQWRGEHRDGIYHETGLLKEWPAEGPQLLWHFDGLGDGYSSAAIANRKIYITGLDDDDLVLFVLDLNGQLLKKAILGKEWTQTSPGPRSTICVNDGKLYIFSALGVLVCLDEETLTEVWSKDLFTEFDGKNADVGANESPLVVGDKIFMTPGGETHNVLALNKCTGDLIWSSAGEGTRSTYSSPQYIGDQSVPIVVNNTVQYIVAFHAETGEKLWSYPQTNQFENHPNTPLYSDGMIFSFTGYGGGSMMLRLKEGGRAVEQVWKHDVDNQMGGAIKIGDDIYVSGHRTRGWYCIDWKTGETKFKSDELGNGTIISADGMLYIYTDRGELALVKPNPEKFDVVSKCIITLGTNQHWAHLVIYDGVLYVRHGDTLMAYKIK